MNVKESLLRQIERFERYSARLKAKSRKFANYRMVVLLSGVFLFFLSFFLLPSLYSYIMLVVFPLTLGILANFHGKIDKGIKRANLWIDIKKWNLARINIDWSNLPAPKEAELRQENFIETDLNISGEKSLLHLIDTTATSEGINRLRQRLTSQPVSIDSIMKQQNIIKELVPLARFREKIQLKSLLISKKAENTKGFIEWLKRSSNTGRIKSLIMPLSIIAAGNVILIILHAAGVLPAYWSFTSLLYIIIYYTNYAYVAGMHGNAVTVEEEAGKLSSILEFLESYNYGNNIHLKELCSPLINGSISPSLFFKRIKNKITALSLQNNPVTFLIFNIAFPWDFYHSYKLSQLKHQLGDALPGWLNVWHELEALNALANLKYLNPEYSFPSFAGEKENVFTAEEVGHPLIAPEGNIKNTFKLNNTGEAVIITGSNMSGKSTFLKTLGINLCMAYAGGAVNASFMSTGLFRVFTSIKIGDSVTDGISYFYAEVKRLKLLLDEIKRENELPLFYLIDEIFRGTNNRERLIGSRSFIKALAGLNGTGLISTHDLELVNLEKEINGISNYHFREEAFERKLIFDYKLHKGPCPTTNALKIMQMEGLPVDE